MKTFIIVNAIIGVFISIFMIFWGALGIHQLLVLHWNPYTIIPMTIICVAFGAITLGIHTKTLLPHSEWAINFVKQIGIAFVMGVLFALAMMAVLAVWTVVLIYSGIKWVMKYDGYSHSKEDVRNIPKYYTKTPEDQYQLDKEIEYAFSNKPFPKSYSPNDNPLYIPTSEELAKLKDSLPPFDRQAVFAAVAASNIRMSEPAATAQRIEARKKRHADRDKGTGRFVKRPLDNTPITRYGEKTSVRFGNQ